MALSIFACGKRHPYIDNDYDFQFVPVTVKHNKLIKIDSQHHSLYAGHLHQFQDQGALKIMQRDGFRIDYINEKINSEVLSNTDILFMAGIGQKEVQPGNWQSELSKDEISSVVAWVQGGGSLLLLTGHFPRGSGAKPLLDSLGVQYFPGYAHHEKFPGRDSFCSWFVFTPAEGLRSHPLIKRQGVSISKVKFLCGSALSRRNEDVVLAMPENTRILKSAQNSKQVASQKQSYAAMIAFNFGSGRVVVASDLGLFRNWVGKDDKGIYYVTLNDPDADNAALLVNTLRWLAKI